MAHSTNKRISALKQIAEEISSITSAEEQIPLLSKGFELFSLETERLSNAYAHLHTQFRKVNQKLEETNERLSVKIQELHVLTNYLDNILSRMSQGLIFIDLTGSMTTYNEAAEEILEQPVTKLIYQKFSDFFEDDQFGYSMSRALADKKAPKITHISLAFADGKQKEVEVSTTFVRHKKGQETENLAEGLIVLLRDISEVRQLQILASRNDRMKALGEMAAQVAHEIRNPLGGIKGFASLLHRDLADKPELLRLTDYIVEGANTLDRLVTQVLNFSRPFHLEIKTINLADVLNDLKEMLLAENALNPSIEFKLTSPKSVLCPGDAGLLKAAIHNLLMNAIQAMPDGGKLTLKLEKNDNRAEIKVIDTGIGIPQDHLKKLFSPFFSTKPDGNGLGLAEAHKVIQAHGGEIAVDSLPGYGTRFTLKIPLQI
ncbi:MAG: ATP-binding protein [Bacteriovorax sp.]|jgi:PAS domain S-box-containing protein